MGCGNNRSPGFVNVDMFEGCSPDLVMDLEILPWSIQAETATEVHFHHSLEHVGQSSDVFLGIMKELYRVCASNARVMIFVPHLHHDHYISDPTHVRPITPELFWLFSRNRCLEWIERGYSNSPLALHCGVDF